MMASCSCLEVSYLADKPSSRAQVDVAEPVKEDPAQTLLL